ncbi:solute carrier family 28 member 3-like [Aplysia californica]|uniref:Solute carrier family 28 member 3-like n=1 Tax=Aplysia californica TaxID=6500 RepID=A0ABM1VZP9_APLCA|nr:solute carrier family 28 member 3-like [Aplysia californica]
MLYHPCVMQVIIGKIAFVMRVTLGTTAAESLCAAGNIFEGQTEAPIMVRPFLALVTRSELHAVMIGRFGTIAGAIPLDCMMGVEWEEAGTVAELLGVETFLNESLAYDKLSSFIDNRIRSEIIATYALCGFANLGSVGIQLGGLCPMVPNRLGDLAQLAVTALLGGIVTNLLTACVAAESTNRNMGGS